MVQHPVGQGGLFCGTLEAGAKPLRWVYDCGSNQGEALSREIAAVAAGGDIDLLFLSHLDSDHVNGVDRLLAQVKVREVVLPYLNDEILVAIVAREVGRGTLNGVIVEAASDLAGWFGSRGVETITFVGGRDDDDGDDGPALPGTPEGGGGEGDVSAKWTRPPETISELIIGSSDRQGVGGEVAKIQQVAAGAALKLITRCAELNWALIPYVHVPPPRLMQAFKVALEAEFKTPLDKRAIIRSAKNQKGRDRLRTCYDALWLDHNLISMTLYAGPRQPDHTEIRLGHKHYYYDYPFGPRGGAGGWILTGDAHLDGQRRRQAFLRYYRNYTPLTSVFMLPHHGSIHNHSTLVLNAMEDLRIGYAASGPNSYGHPHCDVRNAVDACGWAHFCRVDQKPRNQLRVEVRLP